MERLIITGRIAVTSNEDQEILAVVLHSDGGNIYNVILDVQGELLGIDMDGCRVEVNAAIVEDDGEVWLRVYSFDDADDDDTHPDTRDELDDTDDENDDDELDEDDDDDDYDDDEDDEEDDDFWYPNDDDDR